MRLAAAVNLIEDKKLDISRTGISYRDLVERAVRNAKPRDPGQCLRWMVVAQAFGIGSTNATHLCVEFNINPDDMLEGPQEEEEPPEHINFIMKRIVEILVAKAVERIFDKQKETTP